MKRLPQEVLDTGRGVEVNMSPLIDCVFLLLIFFVVTSVFVQETGVEVEKPIASSVEQLDRRSIRLALQADGAVVFGGRVLNAGAVRGVVAQQLRQREVPVVILADRAARTGDLVALIDECKLAGAAQVSVATDER
jgi:biopolymer transport protein ExbD